MTKIKKLEMKNFKGFYGTTSIDFSDGLNVITGENASGKSSILDAIQLILKGKPQNDAICVSYMKTNGAVKLIFENFEISCKISNSTTYKLEYPDFLTKDNVSDYFEHNSEFEIYDNDIFAILNKEDTKKLADELKEKSKTKQIIVVSFDDYLISLADKVVKVEKL